MSEDLKNFFREYIAWVDSGAPNDTPFSRFVALCANVYRSESCGLGGHKTKSEIVELLVSEGKNPSYPFGGVYRFFVDQRKGTMHLNEDRISWVRAKLEAADEQP